MMYSWGRRGRLVVALLSVLGLVGVGCTNPPGGGGAPPTTTIVPLTGPPGEFSLLSYNVAGLPQGISGSNPETNLALISPRLNAYDVVLTQEDFDWWQPVLDLSEFAHHHEWLRSEALHPYRSGQHPGPLAVGLDPNSRPLFVGDGLGMMSVFPFSEPVRVPWTGCYGVLDGASDCLAMKGFSATTMTLADGFEVDVYDLHGEAGGTATDQALQHDGYAQLAAFISTYSAGRAVILAGDTNLHTDVTDPSDPDQADARIWSDFLAATGLTDTCAELSCDAPGNIDKAAYRDGGGVDLTVVRHEYPTADFLDASGADLSDHPPLAVGFSWDAE